MLKVVFGTLLYSVIAGLGIAWFGSLFTIGIVVMGFLGVVALVGILNFYTLPALKMLGSGYSGGSGNSKVS